MIFTKMPIVMYSSVTGCLASIGPGIPAAHLLRFFRLIKRSRKLGGAVFFLRAVSRTYTRFDDTGCQVPKAGAYVSVETPYSQLLGYAAKNQTDAGFRVCYLLYLQGLTGSSGEGGTNRKMTF